MEQGNKTTWSDLERVAMDELKDPMKHGIERDHVRLITCEYVIQQVSIAPPTPPTQETLTTNK